MENPVPSPIQGSQSLQALQRILAAGAPRLDLLEALLHDLEGERRLEHAWLLLKQARPDPALWGAFQARLKSAMEQSRARRMSQWQADPDRRTLRMRFAVQAPAHAQHPAGLLATLARALMDAGLPLAMGLEKSPRPAVHLGHPLPLLAEGLSEWADAALLNGVATPLEELPGWINARAPRGLAILQCLWVPNHASPVAQLCRRAHWRWTCPDGALEQARERMAIFLGSDRFEMEKTAKVKGEKGARQVDIRPLLEDCRWTGGDLLFQTRIAPGEAGNPGKLLAAILGPAAAGGELTRTQVELGEDPRLLQADRFQPKLHNMFEDAVLLDSGSNIRIVEDDDEDPIVL